MAISKKRQREIAFRTFLSRAFIYDRKSDEKPGDFLKKEGGDLFSDMKSEELNVRPDSDTLIGLPFPICRRR